MRQKDNAYYDNVNRNVDQSIWNKHFGLNNGSSLN